LADLLAGEDEGLLDEVSVTELGDCDAGHEGAPKQ
jgi:hypothetical protein